MITWSAPIYLYLWMAGMAAGAYFAAFLAKRFAGEADRRLLQLATYVGIPLAVIGVLLLVVDLGSPLRFWHLFTQFKVISPMSIGTWILLVWVGIAIIMAIFWWTERFLTDEAAHDLRQTTDALGWVELVFSVLLMAYTGVLLANSSLPLWAGTLLLPALFVASAISTGVAIVIITAIIATAITRSSLVELQLAIKQIFATADWAIPSRMVSRLAEADTVVIFIELLTLVGYAIWLGNSVMAGADEALRLITTGALAAPFWVGVVLLALLVPLSLEIANWGKEIETKGVWRAIITSSACVILGGLILRAVIVLGGQM